MAASKHEAIERNVGLLAILLVVVTRRHSTED